MQANCPVCSKAGLDITTNTHNIPYFDDVMETVFKCKSCGYRSVDVLVLGEHEASRHTLEIEDEKDINARIVRSGTSTVEIPELGVKITPGPDSEGYITNVEGVLSRIEKAIRMNPPSDKSDEVLKRMELAKEGKEKLTLIIEDKSGNSAIISKKARKEEI
jgi:zinc finger protein